jgi:hypothetical protein
VRVCRTAAEALEEVEDRQDLPPEDLSATANMMFGECKMAAARK